MKKAHPDSSQRRSKYACPKPVTLSPTLNVRYNYSDHEVSSSWAVGAGEVGLPKHSRQPRGCCLFPQTLCTVCSFSPEVCKKKDAPQLSSVQGDCLSAPFARGSTGQSFTISSVLCINRSQSLNEQSGRLHPTLMATCVKSKMARICLRPELGVSCRNKEEYDTNRNMAG